MQWIQEARPQFQTQLEDKHMEKNMFTLVCTKAENNRFCEWLTKKSASLEGHPGSKLKGISSIDHGGFLH